MATALAHIRIRAGMEVHFEQSSTTITGSSPHQSSEHHEAAAPELRELTDSMRLEWIDSIQQASSLAPTNPLPLPADAHPGAVHHHERFADLGEDWWRELR